MKKLLAMFFLISSLSVGYSLNIDYGATIDSYVGASLESDSTVFGFEKLSLYGSLMFTENTSLALDGYYKFSYDATEGDLTHVLDFDTLLFSSSISLKRNDILYEVGRGYKSDYSGDIFAHKLDGASITLPFSFATLYGHIGYTGLIHRDEDSLISTKQDELKDEERDNIKLVIEGLDFVSETDLMTFWGSIYATQDLRPENLAKNYSVYIGAGFQGSIRTDLFYSLRGNFKTGGFSYSEVASEDEPTDSTMITAGMGALSLDWFIRFDNVSHLNPMLSLDVGVSSGDDSVIDSQIGSVQGKELDSISLYSPIVSTGPGSIYSTSNTNLTYCKVDASISPLNNLQTSLGSVVFFRTVEGVTGDSNVGADTSGNYLGTEISLTANWRLFSDLGVSLSGGVNIPNKDITGQDISGLIAAYVSLSL